MKRIVGVIAVLASLSACQKEDTRPTTLVDDTKPLIQKSFGGCCTTFFEDGDKYGCSGACCDCMECESVASGDRAAIDAVIAAVVGGDPTTISNTFHTYESVLNNYMHAGDVSRVINGTASVRYRGPDTAGYYYFILTTGGSRVVYKIL